MVLTAPPPAAAVDRRRPRSRPAIDPTTARSGLWAGTLLLPKLAVFAAFVVLPFFWTFVLIFQQGNILQGFHWVGLQNFRELAVDDLFRQTAVNTALFMAMVIPASILIPGTIGVYLARPGRAIAVYRTCIYVPSLLSIIATGLIWRFMVSPDGGPLYRLFNQALGIDVQWLTDPTVALAYVAVASLWSSIGVLSVIFMAGFLAIPAELVEAGQIDGANAWQIFWLIKVPQLRRIIQLVLVLVTISSVQVFDIIFVLTKGGPGTGTYTAQWYVFQNVFNGGSLGYAAAMGVVILLITIVLSVLSSLITREKE